MIYKVHERFHSIQGEGIYSGCSAFFIRLMGCPVHCPWCDSAGTWHADYIPKPEEMRKHLFESAFLAEEARQSDAVFVVITGGEPCIHDLTTLVNDIHNAGLKVHLETCGAFPITPEMDWITLSPKFNMPPLDQNYQEANEIKIIGDTIENIDYWVAEISAIRFQFQFETRLPLVWLHPEWSQRNNPNILSYIVRTCLKYPWIRAGLQTHRYFNADSRDSRSEKQAPLGGDPKNGY